MSLSIRRYILAILALVSITVSGADTGCDDLSFFCDSFESGDMTRTNTEGFRWESSGRTGVVRGDPQEVVSGRSAIRALPIENKDWTAKEGGHSLIFSYPSGMNMSEQRFNLGTPHRNLWIRFWARVPVNFTHNSSSPSNSKFFAIWMDDYSAHGDGSTVIWEFWNNRAGGSNLTLHYNETGGRDTRHEQSIPFIQVPDDRGRWMQVLIHVKSATSSSVRDGSLALWRRWENEVDFTRLHHKSGMNFTTPPDTEGWGGGYLLGWSNPGYLEDTEWLVDTFTLSDHSLLLKSGSMESRPLPPDNIEVVISE